MGLRRPLSLAASIDWVSFAGVLNGRLCMVSDVESDELSSIYGLGVCNCRRVMSSGVSKCAIVVD